MFQNNHNFPPLSGSKRPRTDSNPNSPILSNYDRYFKICLNTGSFKTMSPFLINKCLHSYFGTLADIRKQTDGSLLIEVSNEQQSFLANNFSKLHTYDVSTTPHKTLNTVKGVITCTDLVNCSDEEILENLKDQAVTSIYRIPPKKGTDRPSNTFIISFKLHQLPKRIKAGFYSLRVRQYFPNPMRCFNCQQFGHTALKCSNPAMCPSCGHPKHTESPCSSPSKCANCNESHSPGYKGCSIYKKEFEIQKIRIQEKLSYFEAKRKYNSLHPALATSFSTVLSRKPQMTSVSTQCDFPATSTKTTTSSLLPPLHIPSNSSQSPIFPTPNSKSSSSSSSNIHTTPSTEVSIKKLTKPNTTKPSTPTPSKKLPINNPIIQLQKSTTNQKDPPKKKQNRSTKTTPTSSSESILELTSSDFMEIESNNDNNKTKKK